MSVSRNAQQLVDQIIKFGVKKDEEFLRKIKEHEKNLRKLGEEIEKRCLEIDRIKVKSLRAAKQEELFS